MIETALMKTDTIKRVVVQQYLGYRVSLVPIYCEGAEFDVRHPS